MVTFKRRLLPAILLLQLLLLPSPTEAASRTTQPNFIIILADDLGYGDLGVYGADKIKTPNLDRMASEGARFTAFYSSSTVCTPTRAAFLTGRHAMRVGLDFIIPLTGPRSQHGLPASEVTLPEVLKEAGYTTAIVGKWHLGHQPEYNPTLHGFETWFGVPYSNSYNDGDVPLYRDTAVIEYPVDQRYLTQRYTQEALAFINQNAARPFFLYLPHTFPHVPLYASPDFEGSSQAGLYGDVVEEIDWSVGQILAELVKLGLDDNTLVVFTSDNGPWTYQGEQGGSSGPFYCGKGSFFEGGVRVPFIARWPGAIPPGAVVSELAVTYDLFPTLVHLAGAQLPGDRVIDGADIRTLLSGGGERQDDELVFSFDGHLRGMRAGPWKLLLAYPGGPEWMDSCGSQPYPLSLFNLLEDPGETTNLAGAYPGVVAFLQGELAAFEQSLAQPANQPPVAQFTASTAVGDPASLHFDASGSFDLEGGLVSYQWDFGDGAAANGAVVTHIYDAPGSHIVTLSVVDEGGLADGTIGSVEIGIGDYFLPLVMAD